MRKTVINVINKIVDDVLLEEDFEIKDMKKEVYLNGCYGLSKNRMLKYLLQKIKKELIIKLTRSDITHITSEEESFYRGGLYVVRHMEEAIMSGKQTKEKLEELNNY